MNHSSFSPLGDKALGDKELRIIPWIVAIAFFMQMLDTSILNTALPSIANSLHESPLNMHWAVISYMLTVAVLLPISGWVSDRFGARNVLLAAVGIFSLGSLLCALSTTLSFMVAARVVQGLGGAFMLPVGRLIVLRIYPRESMVRVLSFITIPGLIGPLLGPTIGGFLVQYASWHWIFLINLPVGVIGGWAIRRYIPLLWGAEVTRFDLRGFALCGAAMVLVSLALDTMSNLDTPVWLSASLLVGGVICLALYIPHAKRSEEPLFHLDIFRLRTFTVGILGNLFARLANGGLPFLAPLLLQMVMGYSPFAAGMALIPMTAMSMFSKTIATPLLARYSYRTVLTTNTILLAMLIAAFSLLSPRTPLPVILLLFGVFGAVNSMQFTAMNTLALIDLPPEETTSGNSLLSMVMQLSQSMGVALAATLLTLFAPPVTGSVDNSAAIPQAALALTFSRTYLFLGVIALGTAAIFTFTPNEAGKNLQRSKPAA